jgi:DNA-binding beta-propeller fold protein YncE
MISRIPNLPAWAAILLISSCERSSSQTAATGRTDETPAQTANGTVEVVDVWRLSAELMEISANVLVDEQRMACIQDNAGTIYIYNLKTKTIDQKIVFTGKGDFEALALVGNIFYVLRADGQLYRVEQTAGGLPRVETFDSPLSVENDTESMYYDAPGNRLLIAVKEKNLGASKGKEVYAFDLETNTLQGKPVFTIEETDNTEAVGQKKKEKKKDKGLRPSEIAQHPATGEWYVLNGPTSTLFIADKQGRITRQYPLDKNTFPQPEGLCFSKTGALFISSEGSKNGSGIIALVRLQVN